MNSEFLSFKRSSYALCMYNVFLIQENIDMFSNSLPIRMEITFALWLLSNSNDEIPKEPKIFLTMLGFETFFKKLKNFILLMQTVTLAVVTPAYSTTAESPPFPSNSWTLTWRHQPIKSSHKDLKYQSRRLSCFSESFKK